MNVGLVVYGSLDTISGGYLYDRMLVSHLRQRGDAVEIISLPPGRYGPKLLDNFRFREPTGFDIILQDELCHPSLLIPNARPHACAIISIVHNLRSARARMPQEAFYGFVERWYLNRVDGFIFNSSATSRSVLAATRGAKPYVIAPPGGDRLGEIREDAIKARAVKRGPLRLVFLANVVRGKGLDILLDSLKRLPRSSYVLEVVGSCDVEPAYARRVQDSASRTGLAVHFHGVVDHQPLAAILGHSHALVIPSQFEGFGIAYLEGMAHGLPALGTTAGAIPDLVSDGIDGFLIAPGDADSLSQRLALLGNNRRLLARMGIAALQNYRSRPTWVASTELMRNFLLESVNRRSASPDGQGQRASH
jgi:glycosyltransferase involved in cell wall biosynthesis